MIDLIQEYVNECLDQDVTFDKIVESLANIARGQVENRKFKEASK